MGVTQQHYSKLRACDSSTESVPPRYDIIRMMTTARRCHLKVCFGICLKSWRPCVNIRQLMVAIGLTSILQASAYLNKLGLHTNILRRNWMSFLKISVYVVHQALNDPTRHPIASFSCSFWQPRCD